MGNTVTVVCVECLKRFEMDEQKFERIVRNNQGVRIIHEGRPPIFCSTKCGELWLIRSREKYHIAYNKR
jgi:hypothetical protein